MTRGPLPNPNPARTSPFAIPATDLPAGGRKGRIPAVPAWITLETAGQAWWQWAWRTPQSVAWSIGDIPNIARRASLEDLLDNFETIAAKGYGVAAVEAEKGKLRTLRQAATWDAEIGLTPRGMAALRWKIVADAPPATVTPVSDLDDRRRRLSG